MNGDEPTLPPPVASAMRAHLPVVAERAVAEIIDEVPSYSAAFRGAMGRTIRGAVEVALAGFLELASTRSRGDAGTPIGPALEGAYELGRGEARNGRSMVALLAAYRVGARVSWQGLSTTAVSAGLSVEALARFAELVFAYIDALSAASVAGHADELATEGRVRGRLLERLAGRLVGGAAPHELDAAAEGADWSPPATLTAVVLPQNRVRGALVSLDARTLQVTEELPGLPAEHELTALLVPDAEGSRRAPLLRALEGRGAVVGPPRPWREVAGSYDRAVRAVELRLSAADEAPLDTDERLAELVLLADGEALADLRARVLAPLADLAPAAREKLTETLRSWLLHHGRREQVAAELFVHPQTVRYRMGQLRDLYGSRLEDPRTVLELTVALAVPRGTAGGGMPV
ncbi:CdaR family transcriptional regulator [Blastococcus sp. TF02A-30]|uniref:PucR family transcriptional regulator n=1 Tax=Blastococcus sp. TF02A-30 TaxID=2250580 RepID=UPI000DEA6455|nr:helix-turn-helix domain-containing protein [Blastococcus sp. TF02A-30]RBY92688.1 PucR family transcriptional regulator [Blastococcus sp. TF02A-30]